MYYRLAYGSGAALVTASVGASVARSDLAAAFAADLDGRSVAFNCDASCNLSEVWTSWGLDPKTMAPTDPLDYNEDAPCPSSCEVLNVLTWTPTDGGCPPPEPNDATSCIAGEHGPLCHADVGCVGYSGCVRCASTGYCTDQPL